ncbi:gamma-glutamylcyclotransferase [Chimaeribacter arupi]|uniref:Gamma-glutamylcyclotransferase n=2 Tax=Yersiniaceae TaxID=1903411 RepID=A0A2N5EKW6_9GAMM|nr:MULTISPECIES: gamma-glutamylcyclotransferase family protein [Yersiniaceae]MBS0970711.1 gamma-glutamylcyclotransferase [Nissabacter archeti]MDV5142090.1 gamma-glutamylcyclotransferase family protein [Chimaeribacter arupi]PLR29104.1 gamma-glutamylcyclotransferase [Chimaeribacter arupi]PLR43156.1 gamma-glutamylcyclotransferase [Chimaeribacter arupi]PLR47389.1 gamma-glutamylcyclotransferase [Chimaeribacter arupi]
MESLFVYGTLGPGRPNAHILENIGGSWEQGHVVGSLQEKGWGAQMGYPGIVLDDSGNRVNGFLFSSENLSHHWQTLDEFEGHEYERVPVDVVTENGLTVKSWLYMLKA